MSTLIVKIYIHRPDFVICSYILMDIRRIGIYAAKRLLNYLSLWISTLDTWLRILKPSSISRNEYASSPLLTRTPIEPLCSTEVARKPSFLVWLGSQAMPNPRNMPRTAGLLVDLKSLSRRNVLTLHAGQPSCCSVFLNPYYYDTKSRFVVLKTSSKDASLSPDLEANFESIPIIHVPLIMLVMLYRKMTSKLAESTKPLSISPDHVK